MTTRGILQPPQINPVGNPWAPNNNPIGILLESIRLASNRNPVASYKNLISTHAAYYRHAIRFLQERSSNPTRTNRRPMGRPQTCHRTPAGTQHESHKHPVGFHRKTHTNCIAIPYASYTLPIRIK